MRAIDVKPAPAENHRPSASEASASATTARTAKSAPASESPALLASVVESLLQLISAHGIERIGSVARNRDRFRGAIWRNPRNWHPSGRYIAHRAACRATCCILPRFTLKHGEILKATSGSIRPPLLVSIVASLARPRQQHQFKICLHILMGRIQHRFVCARGERRHLHAHGIVAIGGNPQPVTAVHIRRRNDLFLSGGIRRGNSSARNWHISRLHHAVNGAY
jgi:hypothetical protein